MATKEFGRTRRGDLYAGIAIPLLGMAAGFGAFALYIETSTGAVYATEAYYSAAAGAMPAVLIALAVESRIDRWAISFAAIAAVIAGLLLLIGEFTALFALAECDRVALPDTQRPLGNPFEPESALFPIRETTNCGTSETLAITLGSLGAGFITVLISGFALAVRRGRHVPVEGNDAAAAGPDGVSAGIAE
jgi:hypothetical protein